MKKPGQNPSDLAKGIGLLVVITAEILAGVLGGLSVGYALFFFANLPRWFMAPTTLLGFSLSLWRLKRLLERTNNGSF